MFPLQNLPIFIEPRNSCRMFQLWYDRNRLNTLTYFHSHSRAYIDLGRLIFVKSGTRVLLEWIIGFYKHLLWKLAAWAPEDSMSGSDAQYSASRQKFDASDCNDARSEKSVDKESTDEANTINVHQIWGVEKGCCWQSWNTSSHVRHCAGIMSKPQCAYLC